MRAVHCDYCGRLARYVDSSIVYGRSYGMIYYCPDCRAWVGVHKGTDEPLGRLADAELREWKKAAHAAFDLFWKGKEKRTRRWVYEWLAKEMGLPQEQTHIGMFDIEQCKQVIRICKEARANGKTFEPQAERKSNRQKRREARAARNER